MTEIAVKITTPPCIVCGQTSTVVLTRAEWVALNWGGLIQNVLPTRSADERELVKSGTHSRCWEQMFGDEDADDDSYPSGEEEGDGS